MKVMILAAGEGRRLLPLTQEIPKPLLQVDGKHLIERHVQRLVAAGLSSFVINLGHLGHQIERALGDGGKFGAEICYSKETQLLDTGGGIAAAMDMLGQDDFVVVNGDIYTDFDFNRLNSLAPGVLGHLIMVDNPAHHPEGDFSINDEGLLMEEGICLTYTGISVLSPLLFRHCDRGPFPLRDLLVPASSSGKLRGEYYGGYWTDVGTLLRYEELKAQRG
ncbi:MAG: nucleotidyltransferase family protein [Proteobacteria bacterium]|nr:nucleotidyltransferase family protein [Pseudomonadota bacterium]